MIPVPLIVALALAYGLRPSPMGPVGLDQSVANGLLRVLGTALVLAAGSLLLGALLARSLKRSSSPYVRLRKRCLRVGRLLDVANLIAFAWILFGLGWMNVVDDRLALGRWVLIDEVLLLAPFLIGQIAVWLSLVPAERELRRRLGDQVTYRRLGAELIRKTRAGFGLVLPAVFLFVALTDLVAYLAPAASRHPYMPILNLVVFSGLLLALAPLLIRLAWPTRPLEPGSLRQRLERLAQRLGFRYSDILVWDTGGLMLNAGITGTLPWFRYVLLTDALVERLEPEEVESVFGHEVGHVAHRHLSYFGLFFVGSVGILALIVQACDWLVEALPLSPGRWPAEGLWPGLVEAAAIVLCLSVLAVWVYLVFGFISRRFERQADIYGCRALSCGEIACPPHAAIAHRSQPQALPARLCPSSIRMFTKSLTDVALMNGSDLEAFTWRHGSIARRIRFLLELEAQPERETWFQKRVSLMRFGIVVCLASTMVLAAAIGALENL